ncbi:MAG: NTP transferase domain-containing protein [Planctomycetes bacterium]|nr:NTP transferase domain-containing protein [Planctomycetota bacterium]
MKPALVLLAGGASRRLGCCKALVELAGATPLERLARAGAASFDADAPLVVGGADDARGCARRSRRASRTRTTPAGRRAARARSPPPWPARPGRDLCLAPVDVPLVPAEVFAALAAAWAAAGAPERGWLAPRCAGRHGHPIVAGRALLAELAGRLAAAPALTLRDLRGLARPLLDVEVSAAEVLDDLDTPADLERLRARLESE